MPATDETYTVTVTSPGGSESRIVHLPKEQVRVMMTDADGDPFVTAAWLAYTDLWMNRPA